MQKFDSEVVKGFLVENEIFIRSKFPESRRSGKSRVGRPKIGLRWVIVALCVLGRMESVSWRDLPHKLSLCHFLIEDEYLQSIPGKSKFNGVWNEINQKSLQSWIRMLGNYIAKPSANSLVADSSGFKFTGGSLWRYLKWAQKRLSKSSKLFKKHTFVLLCLLVQLSLFAFQRAKITIM